MRKPNIYITDIFWNRVFLNIIIETNNLSEEKIYLSSENNMYQFDLEQIGDNKYQAKINITNIKAGKMLENENYSIQIKEDNKEYKDISITSEVGRKLENLDKIYRYCREAYAYTINFEAREIDEEEISCVLKSRYMKVNMKPKKHCIVSKKNIINMCAEFFLQVLYRCFSAIHFNKKNEILLMSETRSPISGNLKALDLRLKERELDKIYKINYSFSKTLEESYPRLVAKWIRLIWVISKQKFVFIDDYSPLFKFIDLDKKTKLIQVWHAGVGFKSVGYARFGFGGPEPYHSCHRKYDYAIVGSKALMPVYAEVFGIKEEKILPYGLPRLDNYLDENIINETKEKLYNQYPELKEKKIILFAPTFRGRNQRIAYYPYENLELKNIFELCEKNDYIFIIKMHPFIKEKIKIPEEYKARIKDVSEYVDINDLFYITDILITDYSSNIYDFSLLNKPIILYTFDLEKYELINKVQRAIKEYAPGKVCDSFKEVIETIRNEDFCLEKLKKFQEENFDNLDVNSSDLIIDNIILKEKIMKKILIICANFIYNFFKLLPVKNKVTMISRQSDSKTLDFKLLEEKFKKLAPKIKICILCRKLEGGANAKLSNKIEYAFHCINQMYHIATSKVVILDSYCILISILKHHKSLKVIQMWHSMGTMKKFGYQILGLKEGSNEKLAKDMRMHKNYDYIFASSKAYAKELAEGFGYGVEKVEIYSLPRVDLLTNNNYKQEIHKKIEKIYPQINEKKNIVYCPTFRKDEKQMGKEIKKLENCIDYTKYNLIIKLHPLSKIKVNNAKTINDKEFSSFDMLFIADYVISDYSCIIYEAAVLNIPLYFWSFDLEHYLDTRGLTFDYKKEVPGLVSENIEGILQEIEKEEYDYKKLEDFRKKYVTKIENCTEDIVDFVTKLIKEN